MLLLKDIYIIFLHLAPHKKKPHTYLTHTPSPATAGYVLYIHKMPVLKGTISSSSCTPIKKPHSTNLTPRAHLSVSVRARLFAQKLDGQAKVADDAGEVVPNEDVLALEVSVSDGRLLGDSVDYSLVVKVSQPCNQQYVSLLQQNF